ncbi:MAG: hypothetical protein NTU44_16585 [Bacteroidetes bacterium]|nr:hypothetical protein [Bacteroidota bacterium]
MKKILEIIIIITLLIVCQQTFCQPLSEAFKLSLIDNLDKNFLCMLDNHINIIKADSNILRLKDGLHLFIIAPKFEYNDGIPDKMIDSLYRDNNFPPSFNSPGYSVSILSILESCPAIRILNNYPIKYGYFKNGISIIILSKLRLNLNTTGIEKIISIVPDERLSGYEAHSSYVYRSHGFYQIITVPLTHCH